MTTSTSLTIEEAVAQIALDRQPRRKLSRLIKIIIRCEGTANDAVGIPFALYPKWAADKAEQLMAAIEAGSIRGRLDG